MALVVLLRGVNVGGHRVFRPSAVARQLRRFDVVSVGAAGTFVVHGRIGRATLRTALTRLLPFGTEVMICDGRDVLRVVASDPFGGSLWEPDTVPFVTVLAKTCRPSSPIPEVFPSTGRWGLRIVGQEGRFVFGVYRREMSAIRHLSRIDILYGVPATTPNWNTVTRVARLLERNASR